MRRIWNAELRNVRLFQKYVFANVAKAFYEGFRPIWSHTYIISCVHSLFRQGSASWAPIKPITFFNLREHSSAFLPYLDFFHGNAPLEVSSPYLVRVRLSEPRAQFFIGAKTLARFEAMHFSPIC